MTVLLPSFHAYMSQVQSFVPYSRCNPLQMDTVRWDTTTCFKPWSSASPLASGCFTANCDMIVEFHLNVLWNAPPDGFWVACWLYKNSLPTMVGDATGEVAGYDVSVRNSGGCPPASGPQANNVSASLTQVLQLVAGDKIWPVAGSATTTSTAGGGDVINHFSGKIIG